MTHRLRALAASLSLGIALSASAAKPPAHPAPEKPKTLSDLMAGMTFRSIGPYRGGRATAVTGVRGDRLTYYFGGSGGGVWKTSDGGANWEPMTDKDFKVGSVGSIAVAESDPNVVWAGTGESPIRGNLSHGDGVWKSTDAGLSWKNVGLRDSRHVSRIRIHPQHPEIVYVAAQGHAWGPNEERGVFRTTDGGASWKKVLFVDASTGAADLAMDPLNPRVLYAGMWQAVRRPWELVSGGSGSSLWRSTDGGDTWKKLTEGLPEELWGRVGAAASAAKPGRVYAMVEAAKKGGLYVSDDYGDKWKHVNDEHKIRERAWYYTWVYADPKDADVVWLPNVEMHRSANGGRSFAAVSVPHGDNHDLWIDPDDPKRMILGNDGGATITPNGGRTWTTQDNQPTAQFYRVATDDRFPYWLYGAQQDNSSVGIPSGVPGQGIEAGDWHSVGGGESGWIAPSRKDPDVVFAGEYGGQITRYDHRTREVRQIMAWPQLADGRATKELRYRFQWNAPIAVDPWEPNVLYHASHILLKSTDEGETWSEASPDLTRNDPSKQGKSGGPVTTDVTGVEVYDTIFALAFSKQEKGVLWAGTDDGLLHVSRDGAKTWQNVTPKPMPEWIQINAIETSPHDKDTVYVAATMYKHDDFKPYLFRTNDGGKTWTKIVNGIPDGAFTRVIRADNARKGLLFAGTETGLYLSFDDGGSWQPFQRNLPAVPITDMQVKDGDLVVATQGRAFWILDDLTPLRLWDEKIASADAVLFKPRPAPRVQTDKIDPEDPPKNVGTNRPNGVIVDFWLKEKPKKGEVVKLEILSEGKVIRSLSSEKKEYEGELKEQLERKELDKDKDKPLEIAAGLNRAVWDMRVFAPTLAPKTVFNEGDKTPPKVGPGTYTVRLTVGARAPLTADAEVTPRPHGPATKDDLLAQHDLLTKIRDRLSETHETVLAIRDVRAQVVDTGERAERLGRGDALKKRAKALAEKLDAVELELTNPNIKADEDDLNYEPKLDHDWVNLAGIVASADRRPTKGSVEYYDVLKKRLDEITARWKGLLSGEVAQFASAADEAKVPRLAPAPKIEKP